MSTPTLDQTYADLNELLHEWPSTPVPPADFMGRVGRVLNQLREHDEAGAKGAGLVREALAELLNDGPDEEVKQRVRDSQAGT